MSLHLVKLCVGAESVADLEQWVAQRMALRQAAGLAPEQVHVTRHTPKRAEALLEGGSLYWVIKGQIACRQPLTDIRPFTDEDGVTRCQLVLEPLIIPVQMKAMRPFQGWRYLDTPPADVGAGEAGADDLPDAMRRELAQMGLL